MWAGQRRETSLDGVAARLYMEGVSSTLGVFGYWYNRLGYPNRAKGYDGFIQSSAFFANKGVMAHCFDFQTAAPSVQIAMIRSTYRTNTTKWSHSL